jgi:predicted phosphodiesterase
VARKAPGQPQRVAVAGDLVDSIGQCRAIAWQMHQQDPDLVVGAGDLVYRSGSIKDYRTRFFPTYNADRPDPGQGAPLMRSRPMVGVLGNHDVGEADRRWKIPPLGSLAYYLYWNQPLNGPDLLAGRHHPKLAPAPAWEPFLHAAGARYGRMGNFSFRTGDVYWIILDSNGYVDWKDPALRTWLEAELRSAQSATWSFVVFHHAAFNLSTMNHTGDWQMRELWPLFQDHRVDLVFTGHLHTYQRTRPIHYTPPPRSGARAILPDLAFDGEHQTRAAYPIHILTGAGGGTTYRTRPPARPKAYHARLVDGINSFSLLDIRGNRLEFRQIDADGKELDRFVLTK